MSADSLNLPGTITLRRTPGGWCARFSGPIAATVRALFGTDEIPTAYTAAASTGEVERAIVANWPGCTVLRAYQGREEADIAAGLHLSHLKGDAK